MDKVKTLEEAAALVPDGATIAIGGLSMNSTPMAFVRELCRRQVRDLTLDVAEPSQLCACLDHLLEVAGNTALMTDELKRILAEHAVGNYRVLINMADELLCTAAQRNLPRLDESLFLDVFQPPSTPRAARSNAKRSSGGAP